RARDAEVLAVLDSYLAKEDLAANAQDCTLAALPGDAARGPLPSRLAYANVLHAVIGEMARGRKRKLDADATAAAILAIGAISLSGRSNLLSWKESTIAFSPASIFSTPAARQSSFSATVFSRNSASAGSLPKRSTSSAAKASISPWLASWPIRR